MDSANACGALFRTPLILLTISVMVVGVAHGAGDWSDPVMVGVDDNYNAISPGVGVSPDGTVWVVWSAFDPDELDDEIAYVTIADGVQSPQGLVHAPNAAMDRIPFVSVGSDGVPWVIWERFGDGYEQVVSYWSGDSWATPEIVLSQGGRYDWYGIWAASSSDVWVARDARAAGRDDRDIYLRHWDGISWSEVEQLGFPDVDDQGPVMAIGLDGRAWVAWLSDAPAGPNDVVYAARRDAGGWSSPAVVDTMPGNLVMCDMDLLPDGRPVVVWTGNGYSMSSDIEYAVWEETGWEYRGLVNEPDTPGVADDAGARLSRNGLGELWAVWRAMDVGAPVKEIRAVRWDAGEWSGEELVSAPDSAHLAWDGRAEVATADDGTVWAVWERRQDAFPWDTDVFAACRDAFTCVEAWGFAAQVLSDGVGLGWHVSGEYVDIGFHVWRARKGEGEGQGGPDGVLSDTTRITQTPVAGCSDCSAVDRSVMSGETYRYWLESGDDQITLGPLEVSVVYGQATLPRGIAAVRPNPSGGGVYLDLSWEPGEAATLSIYTVAGRLVRTWALVGDDQGPQDGATAIVEWNGRDSSGRRVSSGVYLAVLREDGRPLETGTQAVVLLR